MNSIDINAYMRKYWKHIAAQDASELRAFFADDAVIRWHCTNEQFTTDEFIRANCEYPGTWQAAVERIEAAGNKIITAVRVFTEGMSFHVCSFFTIAKVGKITALDEYWGDDGAAPKWRQEMGIGRTISDS